MISVAILAPGRWREYHIVAAVAGPHQMQTTTTGKISLTTLYWKDLDLDHQMQTDDYWKVAQARLLALRDIIVM